MMAPVLSIVLPAYEEGSHLAGSLRIIRDVVRGQEDSYEIIVVDDGSPDETWSVLTQLRSEIPELRAVSLARNFGKEAAICAGLDAAEGQAVIVMDCDLQHPPALIPRMVALWREGFQIVNAVKADRGRESPLHRLCARLFYRSFEKLAATPLSNSSDFKLLDREVVDIYRALPERNTFFRGLISWMGYKQAVVEFEVGDRTAGRSSWSVLKLAGMATRAIVSFSTTPLHFVTLIGILFLLFSIGLGMQTLTVFLTGGAVEGFTTVILLLLIVSALLMISLGIIGQYVAQIYEEVKTRPRYLVKDRLREATDSEMTVAGERKNRIRIKIPEKYSVS